MCSTNYKGWVSPCSKGRVRKKTTLDPKVTRRGGKRQRGWTTSVKEQEGKKGQMNNLIGIIWIYKDAKPFKVSQNSYNTTIYIIIKSSTTLFSVERFYKKTNSVTRQQSRLFWLTYFCVITGYTDTHTHITVHTFLRNKSPCRVVGVVVDRHRVPQEFPHASADGSSRADRPRVNWATCSQAWWIYPSGSPRPF